MPKEVVPSVNETPSASPIEVATLYAGTKVRYLLEAFNHAKGSREEIEVRKKAFLDLIRQYNYALRRSNVRAQNEVKDSDSHRAELHNRIIEIIRNISLSKEITPDQRAVAEYLVRDRKQVEKMISSYFSNISSTDPSQHSLLQQARRGGGYFTGRREED